MEISFKMKGSVGRRGERRRLILRLIREGGGHLGADELYRRAKEVEPRISLSTVYRGLKLFKELGLIEERHLSEEHHHYEMKRPSEHCHLICRGCGNVIEFESTLVGHMKSEIERKEGFQVTDAEIYLKGYCPKCQKEKD